MGDAEVARIGMFLNLFDVHVNRAPVGGRVAALRYTKGRFVNASRDKASLNNERMAIRVAPPEGPRSPMCRSPAWSPAASSATCARASISWPASASASSASARRVDVYCPPPYVPMVVAGQRMVGGETVIADRLAQEPPRQGVAH